MIDMELFEISSCGEIVIGRNAIDRIPYLCSRLNLKGKAVLVTDKIIYDAVGKGVSSSLSSCFEKVDLVLIEGKASERNVSIVQGKLKSCRDVAVFGAGGGTVIDVAKLAASRENRPFISVPTIAATDAMASPWSVLWEKGRSHAFKAKPPVAVIGDLDILINAPYRFQRAGFGDFISKVTALRDWKLAYLLGKEKYDEYSATIAKAVTDLLIKHADEIGRKTEKGFKTLLEALIFDGFLMAAAGTTRVAAGSEHLFAFALASLAPGSGLHGEQCGLGTILMSKLHGLDWRKVKDALMKAKAPTTARELGVKDSVVIEALTLAHKTRDWYTILGDGISREAAERLARETEVVG